MPENAKNKVKFGLKACYIAKAVDDGEGNLSYSKPVHLPGARSLSFEPQGENTNWYADNGVYWSGTANSGFQGDFVCAMIPDWFRKDILGETEDDNKVLGEYNNSLGSQFAFLVQFEGDKKATRWAFLNCTCSRPNVNGSTTEEKIEPEEETLTITAVPRISDGLVRLKTTEDTPETVYNGWFDTVYEPVHA